MTLNRVKGGRAVTFIRYLTSMVSLIFLPKTLIWNRITLWPWNLLNLVELVKNELSNSVSKTFFQSSFFFLIYHWGVEMKSFKSIRKQKFLSKFKWFFDRSLISRERASKLYLVNYAFIYLYINIDIQDHKIN